MVPLKQLVVEAFSEVPPVYWVELEKYRGEYDDDVVDILTTPYSPEHFYLNEAFLISATPTVAIRILGLLMFIRATTIEAHRTGLSVGRKGFHFAFSWYFMKSWEPVWNQTFLNVSPKQIAITDHICSKEYANDWTEEENERNEYWDLTEREAFIEFAACWRRHSYTLKQFLPDEDCEFRIP